MDIIFIQDHDGRRIGERASMDDVIAKKLMRAGIVVPKNSPFAKDILKKQIERTIAEAKAEEKRKEKEKKKSLAEKVSHVIESAAIEPDEVAVMPKPKPKRKRKPRAKK